jgi:sulfate adenylyltransferase subunit 1
MRATSDFEVRDRLEHFLDLELNKGLLRFTTAGSVDDGKSTLIGRLLHDCKAVYEDQLDSVKNSRVNRSGKAIDFSLLTDGLRAEREQGITIDVAYRYFSTARRKFIIADTPGHEQYTRNMVTGASNSDLAVILIDATKGLLPQTRRHSKIASLLGISQVLAAVNKMDLVGYKEEVFWQLRDDLSGLVRQMGIPNLQCIPISALEGDNIVARSVNTPWYTGPTLLEHLETVPIERAVEIEALRFPVQSVIRPDRGFRGFAGRIASGTVRPGDVVLALPSKQRTRVESIVTFDGDLDSARSSQSVVLKLTDQIDLSRGDLLVSEESLPFVSSRFVATVVWLHATPLELNQPYLAKHTGRQVKAKATRICFRVDVNDLSEHSAKQLEMNEIALVEFETSQPLFFDPYDLNRTTGSLILIDPLSNATVGAVMIRESLSSPPKSSSRLIDHPQTENDGAITLEQRIRRRGHRPAIFTVDGDRMWAEKLERELLSRGFETVLINYVEIPTPARRTLFAALWNLGLVIICWAEIRIPFRGRSVLVQIAGESSFDLSAASRSGDERIEFQRAIDHAETVRLRSGEIRMTKESQ